MTIEPLGEKSYRATDEDGTVAVFYVRPGRSWMDIVLLASMAMERAKNQESA
jgi:hypothetical protein